MSDLPTRDLQPEQLSDIRNWERVMQTYLEGDLLTREEAANDPKVIDKVLRNHYNGLEPSFVMGWTGQPWKPGDRR